MYLRLFLALPAAEVPEQVLIRIWRLLAFTGSERNAGHCSDRRVMVM